MTFQEFIDQQRAEHERLVREAIERMEARSGPLDDEQREWLLKEVLAATERLIWGGRQ